MNLIHIAALISLSLLTPNYLFADEPLTPIEPLKKQSQPLEAFEAEWKKIDFTASKRTIEKYRTHAKIDDEKFILAEELSLLYLKASEQKDARAKFTPGEWGVLQSAAAFLKKQNAETEKFESSLSKKDIDYITQDNPEAIARKIQRLSLLSSETCSESDYQSLKQKIGLPEMADKATLVTMLIMQYENKYYQNYLVRTVALLNEARFKKTKAFLSAYYARAAKVPIELDAPRLLNYEQQLMRRGIAKDEIKKFIAGFAAKSPKCLAHLSIPFYKRMQKDILMERGKFLLEGLKKVIAKTKSRPTDINLVPVEEHHPIFGDRKDTYGRYFEIKYSDHTVSLISLGEDGEVSKDDIVIGPEAI